MKSHKRIIPVLLLQNTGLYKTLKFKDPKYIGDPINAIKIFNEKEVDELVFLDILASEKNQGPNYDLLRDIAGECFMPLCYGGGIKDIETIRKVLSVGVEKVSINTAFLKNPNFINDAVAVFGSSTIVVSIDIKKNLFGKYEIYSNRGKTKEKIDLIEWVQEVEKRGAGELLINNIDKDGTLQGYDHSLIKKITSNVSIPVIAAGGASSVLDLKKVIEESKAAAASAGAFFVYKGKHNAVLITYPKKEELE